MTPLRIGMVGCGRLAEAGYLPAFAATEAAELAAVADPDPDRRARVVGVDQHETCEDMIAAGGLDAVLIASPPDTHEDAARVASSAGLAALVEKPPAADLAGARRMARLDPAPWIGFNRRFSLGEGLSGVLADGGELDCELRYRRFSWAPVSVRDPALLDLAPHLTDLALFAGMTGALEVSASSERPERVTIVLESEHAKASLRCACDRPHRERAVARDPGGRTLFRRREGGIARGAVARLRPGPHPLVASLAAQLDAFCEAVRGGEPGSLASAADGVRAMAIVAAASESLARGGEAVRVTNVGARA